MSWLSSPPSTHPSRWYDIDDDAGADGAGDVDYDDDDGDDRIYHMKKMMVVARMMRVMLGRIYTEEEHVKA